MTDTDRLAVAVRDSVADAVDMQFWGVVDLDILTARLIAAGVTAAPAEGLDVERLIESIAYMGTIDIHQQVCAWCGMRYGFPHRDYCPITAQGPALRAALTPEDDR